MRGVALGLYPGGASDAAQHTRAVDEIAATGASHVAAVVLYSQHDVSSYELGAGSKTIADDVLRAVIRRAHRRGLGVLVFPIVQLDVTSPGQWRGTLQPTDPAKWWLSYEAFILHYADIAAQEGAEALLVGSELGSTELWRDRWYHLISGVQRRFDGALIYSANWDHYRHVSFWNRLDAIGVTGYYELTDDDDAPIATLQRAWQSARSELLAWSASRELPLWITEVGYASRNGAATAPWDYTTDNKVDLEDLIRKLSM